MPIRLGISSLSQLERIQLTQVNGGGQAEGWEMRTTTTTCPVPLAGGPKKPRIYSNWMARPQQETMMERNSFVQCVLGRW